MKVAALCPSYAGDILYLTDRDFLWKDFERKKDIIKHTIEKNVDLIVANEIFLSSYSFIYMNKELQNEYRDYSFISGVMEFKMKNKIKSFNKLMVYSNKKVKMNRTKEYSDILEGNDIYGLEVKKIDSLKEHIYPQVNIEGYKVLPLLCCEIYSLLHECIKTPKNPADVITVSCFNLHYFNSPKGKINEVKLKGVVDFLEDLGFLAEDGKIIISNPFWMNGDYRPTTIVANKEGFSIGEEILYAEI